MDYIQSTTGTQRFSTASVPTILPTKQEASLAEAEYGCVDWYPYVTELDKPSEWSGFDGGRDEAAS